MRLLSDQIPSGVRDHGVGTFANPLIGSSIIPQRTRHALHRFVEHDPVIGLHLCNMFWERHEAAHCVWELTTHSPASDGGRRKDSADG